MPSPRPERPISTCRPSAALKQYLAPYLAAKTHRQAAKERHAAVQHQDAAEATQLAYDQYRAAETARILTVSRPAEQAEIAC